jgi:hypothetical protein
MYIAVDLALIMLGVTDKYKTMQSAGLRPFA